jgi:phage baseplate assembly protein W
LGGYVEGEAAIRQFIRKAIVTARYHFAVYGTAYGCELEDLIGQDVSSELLNAEIPRVVREALIYDRRINDVSNFVLRREGDLLFITFDVSTVADVFTEELTL